MRTAIVSIYVVDETEEVFLITVVVPHGDFERILSVGENQVDRFCKKRSAVFIDVAHKFRNTTGEAERIGLLVFRIAFVGKRQAKSAHEECEFAETRGERVVHVNGFGENGIIRIEFNGRTGRSVGFSDVDLRAARNTACKFLTDNAAIATHGHDKLVRKCVHAAHAHAMQTGGNFIRAVVELTTGVELGHHDLDGAHLFFWVDVGRNATAVVGDADAVTRQNRNFDMVAEASQSFVHGVIDHFPNEVVEPANIGRTNVHCRADTNCF